MNYPGRCSCGAVSYETTGEPVFQGNCHCRNCQRATGSAYSALLFFPGAAVTVHGPAASFDKGGESGMTTVVFCPTCASQLMIKPAAMGDMVGIRAGTLDDPAAYVPGFDIFVRSANAWDHMDPALPKFDTYPPRK